MNIAVTDGIQLTPPAFSAGLGSWSRENGTSGSATWATASNAALVPADQDFGACLEIVKAAATTKLRYMGETPLIPGVYLRVSARVKAVAGPMCSVRIAGWAGDGGRNHVGGLVEIGSATQLRSYGEVVEVSAIVSVGARPGVTMAWGTAPVFGHFGLDLIGNDGGAIRIESIRIDDVTADFIPSLIDWVDVRDYGAVGNGVTDDRAAFAAADRAANGGGILVPSGTFRIGSDLSISAPIRFKGKLTAPANARIAFMTSFDFPTYADAFGDETIGFKKALQALFGFTDHVVLDLCGRRVDLTEPMRVEDFAPGLDIFSNRRVISNGQIMAVAGPSWNTTTVSSGATYNTGQPDLLTNVVNVAAIEVGSRVTGQGVGREVYVKDRNVGARTLTLSQPLYGGAGTRSYTFHRYRYMFDFSGMRQLDRINFADIEFICGGISSGIMLPPNGQMNAMRECYMVRPKDRGITSIGRGCQDLLVDRCQFMASDMDLPAQQRTSIAINVNANDTKIRDNRFVRFAHFMVAHGSGHIISGNHWFQGDDSGEGVRFAGLVLTQRNVQTTVTGNYIDNSWVEWTNEHTSDPDFTGSQYSFGGLTLTGNTCLCSHVAPWFTFLTVKPFGQGHYIQGLNVSGNVFKALSGNIDRVDRVDTTHADLDYLNMRNIHFVGNSYNGINTYTGNPLMVQHQQNTAASVWTLPVVEGLPFKGWVKSVESMVADAAITNSGGGRVSEMPWVQNFAGASNRQVQLNWSTPAKGRITLMARMDRPL